MNIPIHTALISVSDKRKLDVLIKALVEHNSALEIISSGGTAKKIREMGYAVTDVSAYTGFPEMPGGLVKTLHPKIHGGLLGELADANQQAYMQQHGIKPIDLVVCNLYPFQSVIAQEGTTLEDARKNIDIGGPTMIRSAAKNFGRVCVVTSPDDYEHFITALAENNGTTQQMRYTGAINAFAHVAQYNSAIQSYLEKQRDTHE